MIGVIVLDGITPRVAGDVGNRHSYCVPVDFEVAHGADMESVLAGAEMDLLPSLLTAGAALVDRGARVLGVTCGLLTQLQQPLAAQIRVPVAVSSLLQLPAVLSVIGADARVGLLTADATLITDERVTAAGLQPDQLNRLSVIDLVDAPHFYRALTGELPDLNVQLATAEIVETVRRALATDSSIGAIVSECANLPPYSAALRAATGLPVWDALDQLNWLWFAAVGRDASFGVNE